MRLNELIAVSVVFLIQGCVHAEERGGTPSSPNYCAKGVCLEVDQLSGEGVNVKTTTEKSQTEIEINNRSGKTILRLLPVSLGTCESKPIIQLKSEAGLYRGSGCLEPPAGNVTTKAEITFMPSSTRESGQPTGFPIFGIWAVDDSPVSFWENGYSLRLGPATKLGW